jgi:hypothetical protein
MNVVAHVIWRSRHMQLPKYELGLTRDFLY